MYSFWFVLVGSFKAFLSLCTLTYSWGFYNIKMLFFILSRISQSAINPTSSSLFSKYVFSCCFYVTCKQSFHNRHSKCVLLISLPKGSNFFLSFAVYWLDILLLASKKQSQSKIYLFIFYFLVCLSEFFQRRFSDTLSKVHYSSHFKVLFIHFLFINNLAALLCYLGSFIVFSSLFF